MTRRAGAPGDGPPARAPLVASAIGVWIIAGVLVAVPSAASATAAALWSAALVAVLAACLVWHGPWSAWVTPAVVILALGAACASSLAFALPARAMAADLVEGDASRIEVRGSVVTKVEPTARGIGFTLRSESLSSHARSLEDPVSVRVYVERDAVTGGMLDLGSVVAVSGRAKVAESSAATVAIVFADAVEVVSEPAGPFRAAADLRRGFVATAAILPGSGGQLLPGLAVGETSAVSPDLDAAMKSSSLAHLTAVSGANCALVVALAYGAASLLRAPRPVRIVAALVALGGFVLLVTPEPSVIRAGAMATIGMIALIIDRQGAGVSVLASAVVVLLISDPWLAASLGFALSAAATAALLVLARPLARGLARWMPQPLALALAIPLAAPLACGPILVLVSSDIPLLGVAANLVAGPAAPAATVLGLAACLLTILPPLTTAAAWLAWMPAAWIASTAETVAGLSWATVPWGGGIPAALLLAGIHVVVVLAITGAGRRRGLRHVRAIAALAILGVAGVAAGGLLMRTPVLGVGPDWMSSWTIAQCDVGQGDAVLVRSGGGVAVIDTGPAPALIERCLDDLSVYRVDLLVLTHFDLDHVGGAPALVGRVDTLLHGPVDDTVAQRLLDEFAGGGTQLVAGAVGVHGVLGRDREAGRPGEQGAQWRVLWPDAGTDARGNDASVVVDIAGVDVPRGLYLGDLSARAQARLRASGRIVGAYPVVKVSHHGSADQDPALYADLSPSVALIGVGVDNDYGHPRAETLALLADAVIVRSDRDGLTLVRAVPGAAGAGATIEIRRDRSVEVGGAE